MVSPIEGTGGSVGSLGCAVDGPELALDSVECAVDGSVERGVVLAVVKPKKHNQTNIVSY